MRNAAPFVELLSFVRRVTKAELSRRITAKLAKNRALPSSQSSFLKRTAAGFSLAFSSGLPDLYNHSVQLARYGDLSPGDVHTFVSGQPRREETEAEESSVQRDTTFRCVYLPNN